MKRRGRPPHPDVLTPREWDVLTLVRDGLTNQQIAERLGISFDAAKYHVGEILSKLHLSTREEAAAWRPQPQVQPARRPAWASALRGLSWPIGLQIASATAMAATVAGLGILLYAVLKSDDGGGDQVEATATAASGAPSGSVTVTPTPLPVTDAIALTMTDGIGVPENLALIIETGCTNCDGPSSSLLRVYRDADGSYVSDTLFKPETVGLGPITVQTNKGPQQQIPTIAGFAMEPDASQIVVNVTYQYELGGGSSSATMLFQSTDGGVTWSDFGALDAGEWMLSDIISGQVIAGHIANPNATVAPSATPYYPPGVFRLYPSGDSIPSPAGADGTWNPVRMSDGTVGWQTSDGRLLTASGEEILHVTGRFNMGQRSFNPPGATAVIWVTGDDYAANTYLQVVDPSGKSSGTYHLPGFTVPGVWVNGALAVVNVALPEPSPLPTGGGFTSTVYPALLDPKDGTVQPMTHPFGDDGYERGRNSIDAVMTGPRARVTGTGSCLNVRAEPSESAAVVECTADGVLLANLGPADDTAWRHVRTPSGHEGFASVDYLKVISEPVSTS